MNLNYKNNLQNYKKVDEQVLVELRFKQALLS